MIGFVRHLLVYPGSTGTRLSLENTTAVGYSCGAHNTTLEDSTDIAPNKQTTKGDHVARRYDDV